MTPIADPLKCKGITNGAKYAIVLMPVFPSDISDQLAVTTTGHVGGNQRASSGGNQGCEERRFSLEDRRFFLRAWTFTMGRLKPDDSEWKTRKRLIDPKLRAAGWRVVKISKCGLRKERPKI